MKDERQRRACSLNREEKTEMIGVGDYVKDSATGRIGEVQGISGKSAWVLFPDNGQAEDPEERIALSLLELIELPKLDSESVRAVVRGDAEVTSFTGGLDLKLSLRPDTEYKASAEDLLAGIRKVKENQQTAQIWLSQLSWWCDEEDGDIWPEIGPEPLLCEESAVLCASELLEKAENACYNEEMEKFRQALADAENILDVWLKAGADLKRIGEYPDFLLQWLTKHDNEDTIDRQSTERQELFKACLDTLCVRGDLKAVEKRGYCYYCGTGIYPQDWEAARDSFLQIYRETGKAWPANTLGYIYYYGRCNNGVPEYEEAFRWFSIGHAGGVHESTYKLGDLFAGGLGVPKNGEIACNLYSSVYQDSLEKFLHGAAWTKFADTAIRMGNCFRDGIGRWEDFEEAYGYYLQADMALRMRMSSGAYFGDESVKARLDETIRKIREVYTDHKKVMREEYPFWMHWMLDRNHRACRMSWKELKDGKFSLTFSRAPDAENGSDRIMATFPAGDYCALLRKITVQTEKGASLTVKDNAGEVLFDDYEFFWEDHHLELLRTGETVAEIETDSFRFRPVVPKADP